MVREDTSNRCASCWAETSFSPRKANKIPSARSIRFIRMLLLRNQHEIYDRHVTTFPCYSCSCLLQGDLSPLQAYICQFKETLSNASEARFSSWGSFSSPNTGRCFVSPPFAPS